eukprot:Opistho-2@22806
MRFGAHRVHRESEGFTLHRQLHTALVVTGQQHGVMRARQLQIEASRGRAIQPPAVALAPGVIVLLQGLDGQRVRNHGRRRDPEGQAWALEQGGALALDQAGVEVGPAERLGGGTTAQEGHIGLQADDMRISQGGIEPGQGLGAVLAPDDQLGDHGVVVRADGIAFAHAGIETDGATLEAHMGRPARDMQRAGRRQETGLGVLGADARLDRMAVHAQLGLLERQRLARGHAQLPLDQILAGDRLSDRVLDLQPRIHLHEIEPTVLLADELDRAGADIADRLGRRHRRVAHLGAALRRHARGGRFLQHLLVATLHRAVALEQVDAITLRVAEDLDLYMAGLLHIALDQHRVVAEAVDRLALAGGQG